MKDKIILPNEIGRAISKLLISKFLIGDKVSKYYNHNYNLVVLLVKNLNYGDLTTFNSSNIISKLSNFNNNFEERRIK
jgi:hypothetical protein